LGQPGGHDEPAFPIPRELRVVARLEALALDLHDARIGVGEIDLGLRLFAKAPPERSIAVHPYESAHQPCLSINVSCLPNLPAPFRMTRNLLQEAEAIAADRR